MPFQSSCARFGLSASAAFLPSSLSGLSLWLDAADSSTITGTTNVTLWSDKSGNGRNASSPAGPSLSTYNGLPVLSFNGTSQYFTSSSTTVPFNAHTFIAIHVPTTLTANHRLFNFQNNQTGDYVIFPFVDVTTPRGYVTSQGGSGAGSINSTNSTLVENSVTTRFNIITAAISSGSQLIFNNGTQQSSNTRTLSSSTQSFWLSIGCVITGGGTGSPAQFYRGQVGEMFVFNRQLNAQERQQMEGYLAWKWGLQSSLPTNHPYYNTRP